MSISEDQWNRWLDVLEDILHEADVHKEFLFGIHINAAIEAVHITLGTERNLPRADYQPEAGRKS
ncbi:MAG: hypothetical protein WBO17_02600 [Sphingorhabdus sp.]